MNLEHPVHPIARSSVVLGRRSRCPGARIGALALLLCCAMAGAVPLTLTITNPDRIGRPGTSEVFSGTIANNTGGSLNASDLFLDFGGYDAVDVTLTQLLGVPDFVIADGATSSFTDLFQFDLGASALVPAIFFADVVVQDSNNDFSDVATVSVRTVPEPGTYGLAGLALIAACVTRLAAAKRRQVVRQDDLPASSAPGALTAICTGGPSC